VGAMIYATHFKTAPKRNLQKSADSTLAGVASR